MIAILILGPPYSSGLRSSRLESSTSPPRASLARWRLITLGPIGPCLKARCTRPSNLYMVQECSFYTPGASLSRDRGVKDRAFRYLSTGHTACNLAVLQF